MKADESRLRSPVPCLLKRTQIWAGVSYKFFQGFLITGIAKSVCVVCLLCVCVVVERRVKSRSKVTHPKTGVDVKIHYNRCFCEWIKMGKKRGVWGTLCANAGYRGEARFACNLQDASQERERRTAPKRAKLLAFGEFGYEGGLGEVASATVIG
jgi:hypothetical protein